MKKYYLLLSLCTLMSLLSCEESFLDRPPYGVYSESNISNKAGVEKLLVAAYANLNGNWPAYSTPDAITSPQSSVGATIHGGEAMKGSYSTDQAPVEEFQEYNVTEGNTFALAYWRFLYDAIDRCNMVLLTLNKVTGMTPDEILQVTAEARFLRGHFNFLLKRAFGNVPWVDEITVDKRVPNTENNDGVTYVNIWPQIAEDFDFARKNLLPTHPDLGRANKWAAEVYYAKTMIYRANFGEYPAGYQEALTVLNDVMTNGVTTKGEKYALGPYYYYNFSAAHENGPESVFAAQHSANDGTTSYSFMFGGAPCGNIEGRFFGVNGVSNAPGWGFGWGFVQPSQWYVDKFRVDTNGLPYLDMYETNPDHVKNDYGIPASDPSFVPDTCLLDPRLDWTVGRRGIPFLDYGVMPGSTWTRVQSDGGPYILKKWFVKDSEGGIYTPNKKELRNAINVCIIRYSDVLLLAAECEARVGSTDNARDLVNQVRDRMNQNTDNPNNWVKKSDGVTNAANYKIGLYSDGPLDPFQTSEGALEAILFERTLELGFEGHRFYDVVRFGKGVDEFKHFTDTMSDYFDWLEGKYYTNTDAFLPIPTNAITNSQKEGKATLTQNPK